MNSPLDTAPGSKQPAYGRILEGLRTEIVSGQWAPGFQIPSTRELVVKWQTSYRMIHTALSALAKEGWIERRHGSGTFVVDPEKRFVCAGIYQSSDFFSDRQSAFGRNLHNALLGQFVHLQKEVQTFIDTRPDPEQVILLPALADAIRSRSIQCLVAPSINYQNISALSRLTIPKAYLGDHAYPSRVTFDQEQFLREGVRRLAAQGCQSVGFLTNFSAPEAPDYVTDIIFKYFEQAVREAGLQTRPEWITKAPRRVLDIEEFGYLEFRRFWALPEKPDGLVVYPDVAARGTICAVLELGIKVPGELKLVLHRNKHVPLWSPFPVTWGISDEDAVARELIEIIERQFRRETISAVSMPYEFKTDP